MSERSVKTCSCPRAPQVMRLWQNQQALALQQWQQQQQWQRMQYWNAMAAYGSAALPTLPGMQPPQPSGPAAVAHPAHGGMSTPPSIASAARSRPPYVYPPQARGIDKTSLAFELPQ